jgi:steroid 5-alpha reductase family enzyme
MFTVAVHLALVGAALVAAFMLLLWAIHLLLKNAAIVDVGWAACLGILAAYYAFAGPGYVQRKWFMAATVGVWSLRLALHLLFDRVIGKPEEGRYVQLRKEWKSNIAVRFLFFFEFQALLDVVLSIPFLLVSLNSRPSLGVVEYLGAAVWLLGMAGEALADQQLKAFKSNPANKGKTCQVGLWRYSRHPNYFFEWLIWMGYAIFAITSPWGILALLSPALILYFLLGLTGIPATEAQALRSRGAEYREYQRRTSAFVPWFPKSLSPKKASS